MNHALMSSPAAILTVLAGTCAFFFWLEQKTKWKLFNYLPPLMFIYAFPCVFSNTGLLAAKSDVYGWIKTIILPMMLVILLLDVNIGAAMRVMGRGIFVMLFGTLGVMIGAPIAYFLIKSQLGPDGWKAFGVLAGSWIGGTGNMAAVSDMIDAQGTEFGLAVLADTAVYIVWLPIMLGSKSLAKWFNKFTGTSADRLEKMRAAAKEAEHEKGPVEMRHLIYLLFIGFGATFLAMEFSELLPLIRSKGQVIISVNTWKILLISAFGIALSFTKARNIPGSHQLAMALIYIFVASMGARAQLEGLGTQAPWFILGGFIWIFIHGGFCLLGAKIFKVDVHTAAIASAANIGGAASAPIVAAYHMQALVPVSILMALIGYAIGNYAAFLTALLCQLLA